MNVNFRLLSNRRRALQMPKRTSVVQKILKHKMKMAKKAAKKKRTVKDAFVGETVVTQCLKEMMCADIANYNGMTVKELLDFEIINGSVDPLYSDPPDNPQDEYIPTPEDLKWDANDN